MTSVDALNDASSASPDPGPTETRRNSLCEALMELNRTSAALSLWCRDPTNFKGNANYNGITLYPLSSEGTRAELVKDVRVLWLEDTSDNIGSNILGIIPDHILSVRDDQTSILEIAEWGYQAMKGNPWHYELVSHVVLLRKLNQLGKKDLLAALLPKAIARSTSSAECVELAHLSEQVGNPDLRFCAIERAASLDRNNPDALVMMAAASLRKGQHALCLLCLDELSRMGALPENATELYAKLNESLSGDSSIKASREANGLIKAGLTATPRRILVVTNLFPPQGSDSCARQIWEFTRGLSTRGHTVSVLSGNTPSHAETTNRNGLEMESKVQRTLKLAGTWDPADGPKPIHDLAEIRRRMKHNKSVVQRAIRSTRAEVVLLGNIDLLGIALIDDALEQGVPVLHVLGRSYPGYTIDEQPLHPDYCLASGSYWLATRILDSGYFPARTEVIYAGARTDSFFKLIPPDRTRLRLCYSGRIAPEKGVHTLVDAATVLSEKGVEFTLEIAGEALMPHYYRELQDKVREAGISDRVKFTGLLDPEGLNALFARSNVLVSPSICDEVFGVSQVEALASGLVVVTTGTGGAREIVRNNVDGLLFEPKDHNSLAEALIRLSQDPGLFARLQASAQPRALVFSTDRSMVKIEATFEQMLASMT